MMLVRPLFPLVPRMRHSLRSIMEARELAQCLASVALLPDNGVSVHETGRSRFHRTVKSGTYFCYKST